MSDTGTPKLDNLIDQVEELHIKVQGWDNRLTIVEENLKQLRDAVEAIRADDPTAGQLPTMPSPTPPEEPCETA